MNSHVDVPISHITDDITMTVTVSGMKRFNFRCWLGLKVLRIVCAIFPFRVDDFVVT